MSGFIEELKWRGMIQDIMPGTEELLAKERVTGYIGFDPTSDSLHVGSLVQIMTLLHFQKAGHRPIALIGGATGMIGDPSGKSEERNLLSEEELHYNEKSISEQLKKFLDFESKNNPAEIVNNYDWFKGINFFAFLRDIGKYLTVSYMLNKESVQRRLETGMSYTEFSYQVLQAEDFYQLYQKKNCKLQMGGSDQWGNILSGIELIRRKGKREAFGLTTPLITKADGTKFGKTESGNIWLDEKKTSPYKFYQFWLNTSDEDAERYIKYFTLISKEEIEKLILEHREAAHLRILQNELAEDVTIRVHGDEAFEKAVKASEILFGKGTKEQIQSLSEKELLEIFEGVPQGNISREKINSGINIVDFLSETSSLSSKSEVRRLIQSGGISINQEKIGSQETAITTSHLLASKYILVQVGKKKYTLVSVADGK